MTAPPTRCCAPATSGRCANTPAPFGQTRYIGPVEIAACNLPKHQAALRSLPGFTRRDGYCGADGCCKVAPSGLCIEHHNLYRRHGVLPRLLLATEPAPMPTPAAPTDLPAVQPPPPNPAPPHAVAPPPRGILDRATGPGTDGASDGEEVEPEPTAPAPTLAEVQEQLAHAHADLAAITALLDADPERSPAWDGNDQPIPLPRRVEIALMPGESQIVADLRASFRGIEQQLGDVDAAIHALGAYGLGSTKERLLQVLPVEDRRALLELDAAELRASLARLRARRLNPPPPERVAEYQRKLDIVDAKLSSLDYDHSPDAGKMVD